MIYKKWSVYKAGFDPVIDSEQRKSRPVLIISKAQIDELLNIFDISPITSQEPGRFVYPNEVLISNKYGLANESILLCHQIRTIDKRRLNKTYREIDAPKLQGEIVEAVCFQPDLS
jgi:mRNA interferase MazF